MENYRRKVDPSGHVLDQNERVTVACVSYLRSRTDNRYFLGKNTIVPSVHMLNETVDIDWRHIKA